MSESGFRPEAQREPAPRRWLLGLIVLVMVVTTAPYVYARLMTPEGYVLSGSHTLAPGDIPVYLSYIEQVKQGDLLFRDLFTSEPHTPFQFNPLWLGVGGLAKVFHLGSLTAFHVARLLLIPVFLLVLERWLQYVFPRWKHRRAALLLLTFGAGVGALVVPWSVATHPGMETFWPMDLWVTEAYSFLTLYQTPHFIAATTLLLLVLHWFMQGLETRRWRYMIQSGFALLALLSFHPFHLPTLVAVMISMLAVLWWTDRKVPWFGIGGAALIAGIASPMMFYHGLLLLLNPIVLGRAVQNVNHTPAWGIVVLSYGAFIPLALLGLWRSWPFRDLRWRLLAAWLLAHYVVFTFPSTLNRRMTEGWLLPLGVFAVVGGVWVWERWIRPRKLEVAALVFAIPLFTLSPLVVISQDIAYWSQSRFRDYPHAFYLKQEFVTAADWLRSSTEPTDIVASGNLTSLMLAGLAARPVVFAHTVETLEFWSKREEFRSAFVETPSINEAEHFLRRWHVKYLVWGPYERAESSFAPQDIPGLEAVFTEADLTVFRVIVER